jgi:hypothetical protein
MVGGELMMVKVMPLRRMLAAHIDHGGDGVSEIFRRRLPPNNRHAMHGRQEGAGEQFIFMSAAGMSEDERKHAGRRKRKPMALT